jgi:hypothetical protein
MKPMTHMAIEKGCDSRVPQNYHRTVFIRETKNFWITEKGTKYKKTYGTIVGSDWPMYEIVLESIQPLANFKAVIVKNEKSDIKTIPNDFRKVAYLWDCKDTFKTITGVTYHKDGYPTNIQHPIKIDVSTIKPLDIPK